MILLETKITALEPLHIGTGKTIGNYSPTLDYIPARTLRGMLGNYLFYNDRDGLFKTLKIDDDVNPMLYFKPATPEGCLATPLGMKWCKKCGKMFNADEINLNECSKCYHEGKKWSGWMRKESLADGKWLPPKHKVKTTISTKCPIVPERHTTYAGDEPNAKAPFNVGAIGKGATFDFRLILPSEYIDDVKESLKEAGIFYGVGGFRSKGYGTILIDRFEESDADEYIGKRSSEIETKSAMVLNSPAIFLKNSNATEIGFRGFAKKYIENIAKKYGISSDIQINRQFIAKSLARGWTIKQGYYLTNIYPALKEGSTAIVNMDTKLVAILEIYGLGYRHHIYGDVYFANEVAL